MNNNKTGIITICKKAGKLAVGMDMVKKVCSEGSAAAVFITTDISEKSFKEVRYVCARNSVKLFRLEMTMDDMWYGLGKKAGIVAMTDNGFAKSCAKGLEQIIIDHDEFEF